MFDTLSELPKLRILQFIVKAIWLLIGWPNMAARLDVILSLFSSPPCRDILLLLVDDNLGRTLVRRAI